MAINAPFKPPLTGGSGGGSGEVNLGANVGAGDANVFRDKTGVTLNFKTLVEGTNITLTDGVDTVTINATDTGEVNNGANLGAGAEVFESKSGVNLQFRSLVAGDNITLTENANDIEFDVIIPIVLRDYTWQSGVYIYGNNEVRISFVAPFDLNVVEIKLLNTLAPTTAGNYLLDVIAPDGNLVTNFDLTTLTNGTLANLSLTTANEEVLKDEIVTLSFDSDNSDLDASGLFVIINCEEI